MKLPKFFIADERGFTIIELLIALAIFTILGTLGLSMGIDFYKSYAISSERNIVVSILQTARNRSLANLRETKHGVYLETSNYVIFEGDSYASRTQSYDEIIKANSAVTHSGLQETVFDALTGKPNATGTITLDDGKRSSVISVENEGRINW